MENTSVVCGMLYQHCGQNNKLTTIGMLFLQNFEGIRKKFMDMNHFKN
jgi:hypothetical protein